VALARQYVEQAQHAGQGPRAAQPPRAARQLPGFCACAAPGVAMAAQTMNSPAMRILRWNMAPPLESSVVK